MRNFHKAAILLIVFGAWLAWPAHSQQVIGPFVQSSDSSYINKFGQNADIDNAATFEDLWDGGGTWAAPTAARVHAIVSTDTNDDSGGTGAEVVRIYGLDGNYNEATEDVTLDGTTPVNTSGSYRMIHRMMVIQYANGANTGVNAGDITATAATDATVTAQISAGYNQTLMAIYMVPAGKRAHIGRLFSSMSSKVNASVVVELIVKPFGEPPQVKNLWAMQDGGSASYQVHYAVLPEISEKSIILLRASSDTDNSAVAGGFDVILTR